MRRFLQLALLPSLLILLIAIAWSCKSSGSKNPMNPGGGTTTADVTITITGINGSNSFSPNPANVIVGQTVAWKNNGGTTHTATADGGSFNTGNIADGSSSVLVTVTTLGDFGYHCSIHPSMTGTLHVTAVP